MTKQQILELFGRSVYQIWLDVAIRHYDSRDPDLAFVAADEFVKELTSIEPHEIS